MRDMQFFYNLKLEEGSIQELMRDVLQAQRTEYHMLEDYPGRDRILKGKYARQIKENGGFAKVLEEVSQINPTVAAVMAVGNEMRNDWQGYNHADVPANLQPEVDRIGPLLRDKWLSLETEDELAELMEMILDEEFDSSTGDSGEDGEADEDGGDSERGEGESGEGQGDQSEDTED